MKTFLKTNTANGCSCYASHTCTTERRKEETCIGRFVDGTHRHGLEAAGLLRSSDGDIGNSYQLVDIY